MNHPYICLTLLGPPLPPPCPTQILEALARSDDTLVQMCGRLGLGCDAVPAELQLRFGATCSERVEHINRRISNYRKVSTAVCASFLQQRRGGGSDAKKVTTRKPHNLSESMRCNVGRKAMTFWGAQKDESRLVKPLFKCIKGEKKKKGRLVGKARGNQNDKLKLITSAGMLTTR